LITVFLTLPVYRISQAKYYKQREEYVKNNLYSSNNEELNKLTKKVHKEQPNVKLQSQSILRKSYGGEWDFNEIIGYINLHFKGNKIKNEYWAVKAKRIVRTSKKTFEHKCHKLDIELHIAEDLDNLEILSAITSYIDTCKNELKNRHIDDSQLNKIGKFIDWRKLKESYCD
jgi:methionine synthase II (cobalamin-independent)